MFAFGKCGDSFRTSSNDGDPSKKSFINIFYLPRSKILPPTRLIWRSCIRYALILSLVLLPVTAALAGDLTKCSRVDGEATMEKCLRALDAADLASIQRWGSKIKEMSDEAKFRATFDAAAQAWLAFRNIECKAKTFESQGGSGYDTIFVSCLVEMNEARIADLKSRVENP
jgi:uncharacterized protein YecT (DUF1311 family)